MSYKKIEERKNLFVQNQNLKIVAKEEFINIFKSSKWVSIEKRKRDFLARTPWKSKQQIKLEKSEEQKKEDDSIIQLLKSKIVQLNTKLDEFENKNLEYEDYSDNMSKL